MIVELDFRTALSWFMSSDPWPMGESERAYVQQRLDAASKKSGYLDWIDAFHRFPEGPCRKPMWDGYGAPAGHCGEDSWGESERKYQSPEYEHGQEYWPMHLQRACPKHGGRPKPSEPPIPVKELNL